MLHFRRKNNTDVLNFDDDFRLNYNLKRFNYFNKIVEANRENNYDTIFFLTNNKRICVVHESEIKLSEDDDLWIEVYEGGLLIDSFNINSVVCISRD